MMTPNLSNVNLQNCGNKRFRSCTVSELHTVLSCLQLHKNVHSQTVVTGHKKHFDVHSATTKRDDIIISITGRQWF